MRGLRASILRLAGLFRHNQRDREVAAEIDSHLQLHTDDNLRVGMTPEQARREAVLKLGGIEPAKEACRDRSTIPFFENLLQDLHFTMRQLKKNPGFTATAVLILTLGIASSVAIFAFVDAALIKPLPYREPSRLVALFESIPLGPRFHLSYPDYLDWKRLNKVFTSLDVYAPYGFTMSTPAGARQADGARVSDGFFRTLGVIPVLGRDFRPGEDLPAAPRTVLLSYAAWQKRYGGRPDVLGKTVILDGAVNTIIGVLPPDFHFAPAEPAEFWTTLHDANKCRGCHGLYGVARLKPGVAFQTALADMKSIATQLEKQYPDSNRDQGAYLLPLPDVIVGDIRPVLIMLLSGAGLLLLIATVNVASLLLVRAQSRKRETAIRGALGASPARLRRQFVTEGLALAGIGSVLGLIAAYWAMQSLSSLIPKDTLASMPYLRGIGLNFTVVIFACAISLTAGILFSLIPALNLSRPEMQQDLTEGGRGFASAMWRRFGAKFVVVELATAMVLLVGAGLLGKSFYRLLNVDTGLQPDHVATLRVGAEGASYSKDEQKLSLERRVVSRLATLPGVKSVGITNALPLGDGDGTTGFQVLGRPYHGEHNEVTYRQVSAGYFPTLQARLSRGRYFTEAEDASKPRVVIINQALASQYFSGEDPIGKRINYNGAPAKSAMEIIGIVKEIQEGQLDAPPRAAMYVPFNQNPTADFAVVVRTSQEEQSVLPALSAAIHQIDSGILVDNPATMKQRIHNSPSAYLHRSSAWLAGGFAAMALLLGVIGLYGVIAYSVSQRRREIGIRMALGAEQTAVYRLILKEAGCLTAAGIAIGLVCSLAAAAFMRGLLFGIRSWDPPTLITVAAALALSALLASYIPAHRAASVNPVEALRAE